jgi:preprotein translocase subunit SecA
MPIKKLILKVLGNAQKKDLKRIAGLVEQINEIEERYQKELDDSDIPEKTKEFRDRIEKGESMEDLLPEAFALVKNACRRLMGRSWRVRDHDYTWDMIPYDVQLIGAVILHEGKIAEMKTGEGKTLVCTMPIYLNALTGKGVHLVTVNDFLVQRDAEWMGGLYHFLGMTVGISMRGQKPEEKLEAFAADVTYTTNNELGFDYLRDNMAPNKKYMAMRGQNYAIVDEVDSILIDEARTPLSISAPGDESTHKYVQYCRLVKDLDPETDYNVDEKMRTSSLTEDGVKKMEKLLGVENIYTEKGFEEVHHIEQALRASFVYKKDIDYVVKDDQVIIVDEFSGRLTPGRRFGQGLHQAVEAKEGVEIKRESKTMATITFQNYFRMYDKLAGMTGTAITEEEEFAAIYNLNVIEIPTHKELVRNDRPDAIYKSEEVKFKAIAKKTKELHAKGQPALIGTISVEKSEALASFLKKEGVPHNILNAKHHEKEAQIIADAGQRGAVTIATSMAGRGTDIKLGPGITDLGGLYIIGSERHESRRIDNQLRGRSGRQGDPGESQFFVSMEDDLMRIFGGGRMQAMMDKLGLPDDMPIENRFISNSIESAQKKVEGRNFDVRKHLVEYDSVLSTHRDIIYTRRRKILDAESNKNEVILLMEQESEKIVLNHPEDPKEMLEVVSTIHLSKTAPLALETIKDLPPEEMMSTIKKYFESEYEEKEKALPAPQMLREAEQFIMLRIIDSHWMRHLDALKELRSAVSLSGYGQRNPLIEYQNHAYELFEELTDKIDRAIVTSLFHVEVKAKTPENVAKQAAAQNVSYSSSDASQNTTPTEKSTKIGRNDPCPCGSGKKYKKCCGMKG